MNILLWLWKYKTVIALAISVGAFAFYVNLADLRGKERDELKRQAKGLRTVIEDHRAWHDETIAALERKVDNDEDRHEFERGETSRNQADREAGDGPLAPVLVNGLRSLGQRQAERTPRNP